MNNIDEIKTVIAHTGSKRIPDLEEEIFANSELTELYITALCKDERWYDWAKDSIAQLIYWYCQEIIKGQWPAAEVVITARSDWSCNYAYHIVGERWHKAEPCIKLNTRYWHNYCKHFGITDE